MLGQNKQIKCYDVGVKISFFLKLSHAAVFLFINLSKALLLRYRLIFFPLSLLCLAILASYFSTIKHTQSPTILLDYSKEQRLFISQKQHLLLLASWQKIAKYQPKSQTVIQQLLNLETDNQNREKYRQEIQYLHPN